MASLVAVRRVHARADQSVEGAYPYISQIVLATGSDEIRRKAVRVLGIVLEILDLSVCLYMEQSLFPATNP